MHHASDPARTSLSASSAVGLAPGLSREYLTHSQVCPIRFADDDTLVVGVVPESFLDALEDVGFAYQRRIVAKVVSAEELDRLIERLVASAERTMELERSIAPRVADDDGFGEIGTDVRDLANQPPVIRDVNVVLLDGDEARVSDIHFQLIRGGALTVRFRLDGVLIPAPRPPRSLPHAVMSRIKLLAGMDIAENRKAQDGRIRIRISGTRDLDLRISTLPTMFGESLVIRLLDRGGGPVELESLGMGQAVFEAVVRRTSRSHGMILVTGPTGSGKTTTLYALLGKREVESEKIITVEDPVEYELPGVAQVPVHRQAGVTMGSALRSILRQDPDVIMVGEMRDTETAEVAIQAAMTGHLVFSTLHTTDAIGAVARLLDLGVADYLVAATLEAVLAQRLVRRICDACRTSYEPAPDHAAIVAGHPVGRIALTRGAGCPACRGTGFKGRIGLFELLLVTDDVKEAITAGARRSALTSLAAAQGMVPLRVDGWAKVEAGLTTVEEVLRVASD